jgi:phosphatidylglycerophosphate synthase
MLTKLKQKIQQMLSSEAKAAHQIGLTPNIVTIVGFALAFLAAVAYAVTTQGQPLWLLVAVILLMVSGFCDTLDGILARTYQQASAFGGFLDSLLDRYCFNGHNNQWVMQSYSWLSRFSQFAYGELRAGKSGSSRYKNGVHRHSRET